MRNLTLLIPGLLGPRPSFSTEYIPQLDTLELILGRGRHRAYPETDYYRVAANMMGLDEYGGEEIPVAAVTRLFDAGEPPQGCWLRADPVHLSPDRDRLMLIDSTVFEFNQHDSLAVASEVNQVLKEYGLQLEAPDPNRWYLRFENRPDIKTTGIATVAGRDINHYLPTGSDAKRFHQLMNEVQMQLHDSDINQDRQSRGAAPVNSIWFWGLGEIPDILDRCWSIVYTGDYFIKGLAMLSGTPCRPVPDGPESILANLPENAELLVVLDHCHVYAQYQDLDNWQKKLQELDEVWISHAYEALMEGLLDEVVIETNEAEFSVNKLALKKFWRRPKSIGSFIETH